MTPTVYHIFIVDDGKKHYYVGTNQRDVLESYTAVVTGVSPGEMSIAHYESDYSLPTIDEMDDNLMLTLPTTKGDLTLSCAEWATRPKGRLMSPGIGHLFGFS